MDVDKRLTSQYKGTRYYFCGEDHKELIHVRDDTVAPFEQSAPNTLMDTPVNPLGW